MNAKDIVGICMRCKEWTTVAESCCSTGVESEGHVYYYDDFCETCGEELPCECEATASKPREGK